MEDGKYYKQLMEEANDIYSNRSGSLLIITFKRFAPDDTNANIGVCGNVADILDSITTTIGDMIKMCPEEVRLKICRTLMEELEYVSREIEEQTPYLPEDPIPP